MKQLCYVLILSGVVDFAMACLDMDGLASVFSGEVTKSCSTSYQNGLRGCGASVNSYARCARSLERILDGYKVFVLADPDCRKIFV